MTRQRAPKRPGCDRQFGTVRRVACGRPADRKVAASVAGAGATTFYACDPYHCLDLRRDLRAEGYEIGRTRSLSPSDFIQPAMSS